MYHDPQNNAQPGGESVPIRILQMRELSGRADGAPRSRTSGAHLFYAQGCFMAGFEDRFDQYVPMPDSQPTYDTMSISQLRCYFAWRTSIRNGQAPNTGVYYIYLYFFELINNIGVGSPMEALADMARIIRAYKDRFVENVPLFKIWFRD